MLPDDEDRIFREITEQLSGSGSKLVKNPAERRLQRALLRMRFSALVLVFSLVLFAFGVAFEPFMAVVAVFLFSAAAVDLWAVRSNRELLASQAALRSARRQGSRPVLPPAPGPSRNVLPDRSGLLQRLEARWQRRMDERGFGQDR